MKEKGLRDLYSPDTFQGIWAGYLRRLHQNIRQISDATLKQRYNQELTGIIHKQGLYTHRR